jgi:hypothetical protein
MKNIPKIGDIIYVDTELHISHGVDDVRGGKAKVSSVKIMNRKCHIIVETFPDTLYAWNYLMPLQVKLGAEFGDEWAKKTPDFRPEFNSFF